MKHFIEVHSVYEIRMTRIHGGKPQRGILYANLKLGRGVRKLRISHEQFLQWGGQGAPDPRQLPVPNTRGGGGA